MRDQDVPAAPSVHVFEPSDPAAGILHEMEIKQLKEVSSPTIGHLDLGSRHL